MFLRHLWLLLFALMRVCALLRQKAVHPEPLMLDLPSTLTESANNLNATYMGRQIVYDCNANEQALDDAIDVRLISATPSSSSASIPHLFHPRPLTSDALDSRPSSINIASSRGLPPCSAISTPPVMGIKFVKATPDDEAAPL